MPKLTRYILVFILILVLMAIRGFEDVLFYDPYLTFFENDYLYIDNPRREVAKLVLFTSLRYLLNTLASLGILYLIYNDKIMICLLYTSPSPRDKRQSRMPSSA